MWRIVCYRVRCRSQVEDCVMLRRLADALAERGEPGYLPYMVKGTDTATGQNVGLLTKVDPTAGLSRTDARVAYPVEGNECGYDGSAGTYGISKHYHTKFVIEGIAVSLIGLHLLAFPTQADRCAQREAQASVARTLVDAALLEGEVIVLGDLNDYSDKVLDVAGNKPTSRVVRILRDGLGSESVNGNKKISGLVEVGAAVLQNDRFTAFYEGASTQQQAPGAIKLSTIDHILLSPRLNSSVVRVSLDHTYAPDAAGESDHWPVVVDFEFQKAAAQQQR